MKISRYQCWLKGIWHSLFTLLTSGDSVSGHNWIDIEEHQNCRVVISQCEICGKIDISWSKKDFK